MKRAIFIFSVIFLFASLVSGQKTKPWTEWTEKEAAKILNDSPWGQTQVEGASEAAPSSTSAITQTMSARREDQRISSANQVESGENKARAPVNYRIRFLSAKPVRGAFARILLMKKANDENLSTQLQGFVERDFSEYVVVTVTAESADSKLVGPTLQFLTDATAEILRDKVYLERKDGKRLVLNDYRPPGPDGMGAKFVFLRKVDGQPFLTADSDNVRFFAQLSDKVKLNVKYKVSDMMYDGKLEY